jgi:predicted nucleic acid-binding protein
MIAVVDTGPLLALAKVQALKHLTSLYSEVWTTPAVFTEAVTAGYACNAPDAETLERAFKNGSLRVQTPQLDTLPRPFFLQRGEDECIRLAIEKQAAWLLVDDLAARQAAEANFAAVGCPTRVKGTLGVIVSATQQAILDRTDAIALITSLKARPDVWLNAALCDQVIRTLQT